MGHIISSLTIDPAIAPDYLNPPTFDPLIGFPNGRKPRGRLIFVA